MPPLQIRDDRGRSPKLLRAPERIVSLVPSDTYTLVRLGVGARLVGRTDYCVEPSEEVARVRAIGGTKDPDLDALLSLAPDLVVMNQEENTKRDVKRLEATGVNVFLTFPKRVEDGVAQVAKLARLLSEPTPVARDLVGWAYRAVLEAERRRSTLTPRRVFVPIWMDPLMTIHEDTFISDQLDLVGATNVFADRRRRYPLAADLGVAAALSAERIGGRDTRYPRVTLDEVRARAPEIVLLPDEPHAFTDEDAEVFRALDRSTGAPSVRRCLGRDLMWPGLRGIEGLARLFELVHGAAG